MKRILELALVLACVPVFSGCDERLPTAEDGGLLPVSARTVEVRLPFEDFVADLRILGGFGHPSSIPRPLVALNPEGTLDARTLLRFGPFPTSASVQNTEGATVVDTMLTYVRGRAVLRFDSLNLPDEPVTLVAGALQSAWDPVSATWELAVDTVGTETSWPEAGAGPVEVLDTVVWDPLEGDSVVIEVDSATLDLWADTTDPRRGLRVRTVTEGTDVRIRSSILRIDARPEVNPDTVTVVSASVTGRTFVYDPPPPPPTGEIRIGGAPAWRAILEFDLPDSIRAPHPACAQVECPLALRSGEVIFASLALESRAAPPAYQPGDSVLLETRPVLQPARLPRSPLGARQQIAPVAMDPAFFGEAPRSLVEVALTSYVQDLLRGETEAGDPVHGTLALLSAFEPSAFGLAAFAGPGEEGAPFLRVILTRADGVGLP